MKRLTRVETELMLNNEQDVTLVEVLSPENYQKFHLPGAINVPIGENFDQQIQKAIPNKINPVIVYCQDIDCNASPKAAARMEDLGYRNVYDYEAGKMDWKEAGLPIE